MNTPLVSIVMPLYNSELYLKDAIESILNQTYKNFEFIIIDDWSTDNSWEIVKNYINIDDRIIYIKNKENLWVAVSRNLWVLKSKWKYVIQFDSDDISFNNRVEKEVFFMEVNNNIWVLWTAWLEIKEGIHQKNILKSNYWVLEWVAPVHQPTIIVRKEIYDSFWIYNENYKNAEDTELWFRWFSKWVKFHNLPDCLLYYRVNKNSLSNKRKLNQMILLNKIFIKWFFIYKIRYNLKWYLAFLDRCFYIIILFLKIDKIINKEKIKRLFFK